MTDRRAEVIAAEPQLFTRDLAAAVDFYCGRLGFDLAFRYGEPPFYAQVARGGARLNLRLSPHRPDRPEPDALAATLTVDDAAALCREFEGSGVAFHQPLRREPWGAETFIVADPDGNLIGFAG